MVMRIDVSQLPIVIVECSREPTIEEVDVLCGTLRKIATRNRRIAFLLDAQFVVPERLTTALRQHAAKRFHDNREVFSEAVVCEGRVIANRHVEWMATGFDLLTGPDKWPVATFRSRVDARIWIDQQLRAERPAPRISEVVTKKSTARGFPAPKKLFSNN